MFFKEQEQTQIGAVLVLAGDAPSLNEATRLRQLMHSRKRPLLLAADGGADHLRALGLEPDLLLGDGDSLQGEFPEGKRIRYDAEKDFSDGEAALAFALENTEGRVLLLGALGGRLDHLLFNIQLPLGQPGGVERVLLSGPGMEAVYSRGPGRILLCGAPGDLLSLVPLSEKVEGICLQGLQYPLENYTLVKGSSRTLSNVLLEEQAIVSHSSGLLLAIHLFSHSKKGGAPMAVRKKPRLRLVTENYRPQKNTLESKLPYCYGLCKDEESYQILGDELLPHIQEGGFMLQTPRSTAVLRVDMAMSCLWPLLKHLFNISSFSNRLEAAEELLKAADFGDEEDTRELQALKQELQDALDDLEALLEREAAEAAAEKEKYKASLQQDQPQEAEQKAEAEQDQPQED